ncbi:MAG: TIGR03643 family protein [Tunicatimonas sp.]
MANIAKKHELSERDTNRIIEMAWEDRTPFDAIEAQFGLPESEVIVLMRQQMKPSSWRMWRARVQGRGTKHQHKRAFDEGRFKSDQQRSITHNHISKR